MIKDNDDAAWTEPEGVMVDDEWTDLAGRQVSRAQSHRIGAKTCPTFTFLYFGRSPEMGGVGP